MIAIEEHWPPPEIEKFMTEFPTDTSRELFAAGNARALFGLS